MVHGARAAAGAPIGQPGRAGERRSESVSSVTHAEPSGRHRSAECRTRGRSAPDRRRSAIVPFYRQGDGVGTGWGRGRDGVGTDGDGVGTEWGRSGDGVGTEWGTGSLSVLSPPGSFAPARELPAAEPPISFPSRGVDVGPPRGALRSIAPSVSCVSPGNRVAGLCVGSAAAAERSGLADPRRSAIALFRHAHRNAERSAALHHPSRASPPGTAWPASAWGAPPPRSHPVSQIREDPRSRCFARAPRTRDHPLEPSAGGLKLPTSQ